MEPAGNCTPATMPLVTATSLTLCRTLEGGQQLTSHLHTFVLALLPVRPLVLSCGACYPGKEESTVPEEQRERDQGTGRLTPERGDAEAERAQAWRQQSAGHWTEASPA